MKENEANCLRRAHYLRFFFKYIDEGRGFNFHDETWFNKNMVETREWSDGSSDFDLGTPPGVGDRWIVIGCGNKENGWMRDLFKMWQGTTSPDEDYHGNMDSRSFKIWVDQYMDVAEKRAILVIDRAPYHVQITDETRRATTVMSRPKLCEWLLGHEAKDESGDLYTEYDLLTAPGRSPTGRSQKGKSKQELYELCRERDPKPKFKNGWTNTTRYMARI